MMWYEKRPKDLTVGDLEGLTLEQIERAVALVNPPDYNAIFQKAKETADSIYLSK